MVTDNMQRNLMKFCCVVSEICQQSRSTDSKQTDMLMTTLLVSPEGEVIINRFNRLTDLI